MPAGRAGYLLLVVHAPPNNSTSVPLAGNRTSPPSLPGEFPLGAAMSSAARRPRRVGKRPRAGCRHRLARPVLASQRSVDVGTVMTRWTGAALTDAENRVRAPFAGQARFEELTRGNSPTVGALQRRCHGVCIAPWQLPRHDHAPGALVGEPVVDVACPLVSRPEHTRAAARPLAAAESRAIFGRHVLDPARVDLLQVLAVADHRLPPRNNRPGGARWRRTQVSSRRR